MDFTYIKFTEEKVAQQNEIKTENSWLVRNLKKGIFKVLTKISPRANPDFENEVDRTYRWYLELDSDGIPRREIGFDEQWLPVMIMPWRDNYGIWTDSNIRLVDRQIFDSVEISKVEFEEMWNKFESTFSNKK